MTLPLNQNESIKAEMTKLYGQLRDITVKLENAEKEFKRLTTASQECLLAEGRAYDAAMECVKKDIVPITEYADVVDNLLSAKSIYHGTKNTLNKHVVIITGMRRKKDNLVNSYRAMEEALTHSGAVVLPFGKQQ